MVLRYSHTILVGLIEGILQICFLSYLFVARIGFIIDGLLEIITKTVPGRGFMGRSLQLRSLSYGHPMRNFAYLHIGFIVGVGILSLIVLNVLT